MFFLLRPDARPQALWAETTHPVPAMSETPAEREARLKWWWDARFGMFIHYGPVIQSL
jgi:alpha-L-fucosidase